ncbi:hypothetical protein EBN88_29110 [Streptomyces triticirhizae]|uniref:Uncharacterized protein n=1 Tax=Streptomyces triticirhizae TaxID=2483353 RepID=A0A3M2KVU4_9ACTN|nr:hypothetical protein EBN88_29110 [Streptomyces triticirhizae]
MPTAGPGTPPPGTPPPDGGGFAGARPGYAPTTPRSWVGPGTGPTIAPWVRSGIPGQPVAAVAPLVIILLGIGTTMAGGFGYATVAAAVLDVVLCAWALRLHFAGRRLAFAPSAPAIQAWCAKVLSFWVLMACGMVVSVPGLNPSGPPEPPGQLAELCAAVTLLAMIYVVPASLARRRRWRTEPVLWGG